MYKVPVALVLIDERVHYTPHRPLPLTNSGARRKIVNMLFKRYGIRERETIFYGVFVIMVAFHEIGRHSNGWVLKNRGSFESPDWKLELFWGAQLSSAGPHIYISLRFRAQDFCWSPQKPISTLESLSFHSSKHLKVLVLSIWMSNFWYFEICHSKY